MNWTELSIVVNLDGCSSIDSPFNSANSLIISFCLSVSFVGVTTLILTKIKVPTLNGNVMLTIPSGTQTGKQFRLKDKGVKNVHGYGHGICVLCL
jgi:DnaJ-class molecular chaperone